MVRSLQNVVKEGLKVRLAKRVRVQEIVTATFHHTSKD